MFAACQFTHGVAPPDDGGGDLPDAGMCESLSTECIGDTLRYCMEVGGTAMDISCGWGCVGDPTAHCAHVVPSGSGGVETDGVTPADVDGAGLLDVPIGDGVTFDSDNGRIGTPAMANMHHGATTGIENGIDFQNRGPISMWRFKSLTITGTVTLVGKRPIALVADGDITIDGIVDARGLCSGFIAGPGGGNGGSAESEPGFPPLGYMTGGGSGAAADSGGGGGGYGSNGGNGEDAAGGTRFGNPEITLLVGGAGGGAGGGGGNYGRGGGGGGALQIVSNTRIVIKTGGINAGGCGGKPGTGTADSGGGGGAGGTILLEAPIITINGTLAANGGGGGGGGGATAGTGSNGALGTTPAPGGQGPTNEMGDPQFGGSGGARNAAAQDGADGSNPGGGGGAVGRIRINTRNGGGAELTNATLSPGDGEMQFSTGSASVK